MAEQTASEPQRRGRRGGGTAWQLPSGQWRGQISLGIAGGKRVRISRTGATQAEVLRKLREAKRDEERGLPVLSKSPRLGEYLTQWLRTMKEQRRPATYRFYETIVRIHLVPEIGHIRLHKLTQRDVNLLLARKLKLARLAEAQKADPSILKPGEKPIRFSPATVDAIRRTLRAALNDALRDDLIGRNVVSLSDTVEVEEFEGRALTRREAERFLEVIRGTRYEVLYRVALCLGMRQGEILGLQKKYLDFEEDVIDVQYQLQRVDGLLTLTVPKTRKSRRKLPLPGNLSRVLQSHLRQQKEDRLKAGGRWQGEHWQLVFMTPLGTPIDPSNLTKDFRLRLQQAGLEQMRFHDLRHSALSFLAAEGAHESVQQAIAGHTQRRTTAHYTHAQLEAMREAAERVAGMLDPEQIEAQKGVS